MRIDKLWMDHNAYIYIRYHPLTMARLLAVLVLYCFQADPWPVRIIGTGEIGLRVAEISKVAEYQCTRCGKTIGKP